MLAPHHLLDVFYFLDDSATLFNLLFVNKKITHIFDNSLSTLSTVHPEYTPNASSIQGDFMSIFSNDLSKYSTLYLSIGCHENTIPLQNQSLDETYDDFEEPELLQYNPEPAIDPEFDELLYESMKPNRTKVKEIKAFVNSKCLTSFRSFDNLEHLTLSYPVLLELFPTSTKGSLPSYFSKLPLQSLTFYDVPLPLPNSLLTILSKYDGVVKKTIVPSTSQYLKEEDISLFRKYPEILFYITHSFKLSLLQYFSNNIYIQTDVINALATKLKGFKKHYYYNIFKEYFPYRIRTSNVDELHSAYHLDAFGCLPSITLPNTLQSLVFNEQKTETRFEYNFSTFNSLTLLHLNASNKRKRLVTLPNTLCNFHEQNFVESYHDITGDLSNVTNLSLCQLNDTSITLPTSLISLTLKWCNYCSTIENLIELNSLKTCDLQGLSVQELYFPNSITSLSLQHCSFLSIVQDYERIFDLHPTVKNCPNILFN
ncbi:Leucine-rich repeat containing protein [Entamoeba marina]